MSITKIIYKDIAPGAAADAAVSSSDAQSFCNISLLPTGARVPNLLTGEWHRCGLDGSVEVLNGQAIPFMSTAMSGEDGAFGSPPAVTVTFDSNYTTLGLWFRFSTNTNEFCSSVRITWYQGATQLDQVAFTPDDPEYFAKNTVTAFNKIVIEFLKTSLPYRYAMLENILIGVVRTFSSKRKELTGVDIQTETDLISAELSIDTLSVGINASEDIDYIFQKKQPMEVYHGDGLVGVFYITESKRYSARRYDVDGENALGILDGSAFSATMLSGATFQEAVDDILGSDFEADIDTTLAAVVLSGYIPDCTRREALMQVCFAAGAVVSTYGTDKVKFFTLPDVGGVVPAGRIYSGATIDTAAMVTAVKVTAHIYTAGTPSSSDDYVTVDGITYIHTTAVTTLANPDVTASDKENVIEVADATLVNAANVSAVAARVYDYYARRNTYTGKIRLEGEEPGGYITVPTPWGGSLSGNITGMSIKLTGIMAAECEVVG